MGDQIIMFISQIFNGLKIGSVYSLVALGYTMVYGIIRLINFAHGDFIMVGSYVLMLTIPAIVAFGLPAWVAVIPAILMCVAVGVIVERAAYKPVREKGNSMTALITAIAMSLLLENGSQAIFGADYQTVPTIIQIPTLAIGKLKIDGATIITIVLGVIIMVALQLFVTYTKQGKAMRADVLRFLSAGVPDDGRDAGPEGLRRGRARRHRLHPGRHGRRSGDRRGRKPDQGVHRHHHRRCDHVRVLRRHCVRHPHHRAPGQAVRPDGRTGNREGVTS